MSMNKQAAKEAKNAEKAAKDATAVLKKADKDDSLTIRALMKNPSDERHIFLEFVRRHRPEIFVKVTQPD